MKTLDPATLTKEEKLKLIYRHTHKDYKGKSGGIGTILVLRAGGTSAVGMTSLTDKEIADKLPYAIKKEAEKRLDAMNKANPDADALAEAMGFATNAHAEEHARFLWTSGSTAFKNWLRGFNPDKAALYDIVTA